MEIVKLLLANKASIESTNDIGQTALHKGKYLNIKFIIPFDYISVLFKASIGGYHEVVGLLIKIERFNINEKDNCSYTALHYGENFNIKFIISFDYISGLFKASIGGFHEVAGILINNEKCDINEKDYCDQRALYLGDYFNYYPFFLCYKSFFRCHSTRPY